MVRVRRWDLMKTDKDPETTQKTPTGQHAILMTRIPSVVLSKKRVRGVRTTFLSNFESSNQYLKPLYYDTLCVGRRLRGFYFQKTGVPGSDRYCLRYLT